MELDSAAVLAVCIGRMRQGQVNNYLNKFGVSSKQQASMIDSELVEDLLDVIGSVARRSAELDLKTWGRLGIRWCTPRSPHFPVQLLALTAPPAILFYRGSSPSEATLERSVAIVGSRNAATVYCDFAVQVGYQVAIHGGVVVSGLALGIDGAAHRGAVKGASDYGDRGGQTIAILGNGLTSIYPAAHRGLAYGILDSGGVLLSQFEPGSSPLPHQFLMRNQLIAGYATATVVIAAAKRSGALNTARCALDLGREVVGVPGAPHDVGMVGCNLLLQDGAHVLLTASEITQFFAAQGLNGVGASTARVAGEVQRPATLKDRVVSLVASEGTVSHSKVVDTLGSEACAVITELELAGILRALPGGVLVVNRG